MNQTSVENNNVLKHTVEFELPATIFKEQDNQEYKSVKKPTYVLKKIQLNAAAYNLVKFEDEQKFKQLKESHEQSNEIFSDASLFNYDFENIYFPELQLPSESTPNLAVRELGAIPLAPLLELIGAVVDVKVRTNSNRNVLWNEVDKYSLSEDKLKKSFSKSVVKLFLLLHMLPVNREGFLGDVTYKQLASYLNVSERTVKNNIQTLADYQFINIEKERVKHFNYTLLDYANKANGNRGGYIKISKNTFNAFLEISDVNVLRFALRLYLRSIKTLEDMKAGKRRTSEAPTYTIEELKSVLPNYKTNPLEIKRMSKQLNHLFQNSLVGEELFFIINKEQVPEQQQLNVVNTINQVILYMLQNGVINFDKKDKADLFQLANQYGLEKTLTAVKLMLNDSVMIESINGKDDFSVGMIIRHLLDFNKCSISDFPLFIN